jgi:Ca2+-binding EF-hand superfamily protein
LSVFQSPEAELLKEETAELAELFRLVDRESTGALAMQELLELLLQMGVKATPREMALLLAEMDANHNGRIEMDEFMAFIQDSNVKQMNRKDIQQAFQVHRCTSSHIVTYSPAAFTVRENCVDRLKR